MLKESALVPNSDIGKNTVGFHLGPVGAGSSVRSSSACSRPNRPTCLVQQPAWVPTLQKPGSDFRMTDFLTFAGVDPATRRAQKPTFA
jgi:hypothetical protein